MTRAALLTSNFIFQNLSPDDTRRRLLSALVGGGVNAGTSPSGRHLAIGRVNPNAFSYVAFNDIFLLGVMPMVASGNQLIVVDEDDSVYQYQIGKLAVLDGYSYTEGLEPEFQLLAAYAHLAVFYRNSLLNRAPESSDPMLKDIEDWLSDVFETNLEIHREATLYHLRRINRTPEFDHAPPLLTSFGRLVHDAAGKPLIEYNFSLLHYRKSLHEFAALKAANAEGDIDSAMLHGAYAVIATAACIEAIANKVYFVSRGEYPPPSEERTSLLRLLEEAEALAHLSHRHFQRLKQTSDEYQIMDRARQLRNMLLHAIESPHEVNPGGLSVLFAELSEESCRTLMAGCRQGLVHVLSQLPEVRDVVSLDGSVRWTGNLEVP